jgi:hypothetical protein
MADLFRQILRMVSGTLERLTHEYQVEALLPLLVPRILNVSYEKQVP